MLLHLSLTLFTVEVHCVAFIQCKLTDLGYYAGLQHKKINKTLRIFFIYRDGLTDARRDLHEGRTDHILKKQSAGLLSIIKILV